MIRIVIGNNVVRGDTVLLWLAMSPHSKKVAGSIPDVGSYCVELALVLSRYSGFLTPPNCP